MSQLGISVGVYSFDEFSLDGRNRRLSRNGQLLALNSKYFDVLLLLVSSAGQLVEKQRIFDEVWDGVFVTDAALTQCIKDIRKQLGDDASNPRFIRTVPKHGYVFIGDVVEANTYATADSTSAALDVGSAARPSQSSQRPYKFLDYYTEQDASLFFGREQEVEMICSHILTHRSFILHGRSGVGKSSILRAGLMPELKAQGHLVFVIRSFTDPVNQIVNALCEALGVEGEKDIDRLIRRVDEDRNVIFFLDQFEEFFLLLTEEARLRFLDTVRYLAAGESPVRLVFALREDLLAEMSQLKVAIPEIFHHEYRLKRLSREQAQAAITCPARAVGCDYEPELVARLLDDISDAGGVDPPQLQIVCDNLYDLREQPGTIRLETYESLGGAQKILADYLERVLRRFNADDLRTAKRILTTLIAEDGGRLVLRATGLEERIGAQSADPRGVNLLIEELVAARVLRRRRQEGAAWIELAHDFLIPEVSRWLTADEVALKRARGVIERSMENYRAHGLLIGGEAVDLLIPFRERLGLTAEEADLLTTSALACARPIPRWLVEASPGASSLISDAAENVDPRVRLRAAEAAGLLRIPEMKSLLRKIALWDRDLTVRKTASISLAEWVGTDVELLLSEGTDDDKAGVIRRAISLAMVRDHDRRLVRLSHLSIPISLLVVGGLMWV